MIGSPLILNCDCWLFNYLANKHVTSIRDPRIRSRIVKIHLKILKEPTSQEKNGVKTWFSTGPLRPSIKLQVCFSLCHVTKCLHFNLIKLIQVFIP